MRKAVVLAFGLFCPVLATGGTIDVPADAPTIQSAVNAAASGDTVRIAKGVYFENVVVAGKTIHFKSKGKVVIDALKDGQAHGPGLWFKPGAEGSSATRLTIRHARSSGVMGDGVLVEAGDVKLKQLTVQACDMRGILFTHDGGIVDKCIVEGCNGGILATADDITIERTTVRNDGTAGITLSSKFATLKNNRIESIEDGPGLSLTASSTPILKHKFKDVGDGVVVDIIGDENELIGCTIEGGTNNNAAIRIDGNDNRVVGNRVRDVSHSAVLIVSGAKETELTKNRFERCGTKEEPTLHLLGIYCRLFSNRISDADGRGIYVGDTSELQGNVVKNGRRDGIHIASGVSGVELRKNVVTGNMGEGFDLRSAPAELIGNKAKQNRTDFASSLMIVIPPSNSFGTTGVPDVE